MNKIYAFVGLLIYFLALLYAVGKKDENKNKYDYFFGGRKLPFWSLAITFVASWWGAGSAISSADLAYTDGMGAFCYYGMPVLLSSFLIILGSKTIRRIGYLTQGKMMEERYSKGVSKMLSILILLYMIFNASSQMVGIGSFFGTYLNIKYEYAIAFGTLIVLIYSMFGGFKAVVLTDIIQFILLTLSSILVFIYAFKNAGGFHVIREISMLQGKPNYMNMFSQMGKYSVYIITFGCSWVIQANVWQRISASRNNSDAKKMAILSFIMYIPLYIIVVLTGMAGLVLYNHFPEGGIIIAIVNDYMSPVVSTLVFIGISAAIMSTMDSLINTGAMTISLDLYKNQDTDEIKNSRLSTLIVTGIAFLIAIRIKSILKISWIASDIITTGAFIPLLLGFVWRRGNSKGALASMVGGIIYCGYNFLITLGLNLPHYWKHNSAEQVIFGMILSLILYIGISFISEAEPKKADNFISKAGLMKEK